MSGELTGRAFLLDQIEAHLPDTWRVITAARIPQTIDAVTLIINHSTIEPAPEAPRARVLNGFELLLASPKSDRSRADLDLDTQVLTLIAAISDNAFVRFDNARKVDISDQYIGWQINLTTISAKEE